MKAMAFSIIYSNIWKIHYFNAGLNGKKTLSLFGIIAVFNIGLCGTIGQIREVAIALPWLVIGHFSKPKYLS
jgi:hypothetical protein